MCPASAYAYPAAYPAAHDPADPSAYAAAYAPADPSAYGACGLLIPCISLISLRISWRAEHRAC